MMLGKGLPFEPVEAAFYDVSVPVGRAVEVRRSPARAAFRSPAGDLVGSFSAGVRDPAFA
ncbi:hypothetical protein [Actinoplanes sp. NPDC051411]|uniref:hypothetical protein n=1 Tax=Actinoplanes sp. NPDC051411 TaxID=3155522 RepID=UPI00341C9A4D